AQLACVGALAFLALAAASARREEPEALLLGFAAGGAVAAALLYAGSRRLREFLRFAWPAGLIFPAAFLLLSPLRPLVLAPFAGQGERPEAELDVRDAPVFLIVFDELSTALLLDETGAIDAAHFPHFARLAGRSTWFRNASANSISTELAVATLLTGRYPDRDRPPTAAGHPHNLLTLLAPDYEVLAFDHLVRLCPERLCDPLSPRSLDVAAAARDLSVVYGHVLLPGRLRERLPPLEGRWSGFAEKGAAAEEPAKADAAQRNGESPAAPAIPFAHDAKRQFESFLAAIDRDARGRLFFIHSLLPHVPYVFLPDGRSYTTSRDFDTLPGWALSDNLWTTDEELVARGLQRVLLQTQMVDGLVGRFLDRLEELGLFDDALIVITADHGVNFVPGIPRRGFSSDPVTWATGLAVPLFVKTPGQRQGRLSDRNVEAVDVTPTILDALGRVPEGLCDGSSALDEAREPAPTKSALPWRGPVRTMPADLTPELFRAAAAKQAVFGSAKGAADYYGLQPFAE
ncbi:MAG TPA: sulfatase-like hydrolase/transferase, partial [Myxococcota bacterium]|nr:sulfatase-like hydrolase/transferase [Myxococcota bacterium]